MPLLLMTQTACVADLQMTQELSRTVGCAAKVHPCRASPPRMDDQLRAQVNQILTRKGLEVSVVSVTGWSRQQDRLFE